MFIQVGNQFLEGLAAMADTVLFSIGNLGEGFAEGGEEEVRVVAEAAGAARLREDAPVAAVGKDRYQLALTRQCQHANVAGGPFLLRDIP